MENSKPFLASAARTIQLEAEAVNELNQHLDSTFEAACSLMLNCTGRVVVTGMGKSGHIGNKIAATLASTGTPAFYVHPGEASHGDMGMFTSSDVVLALSNSGETAEISTILPLIKRMKAPLISITANPHSTLARAADVNLHIGVEKEACPLGLAPTSSTTAQLVLGDALAIALLEAKGFTAEDFAFSHPGGSLGRRLLLRVRNIMHSGTDVPKVPKDTSVHEALIEITNKRLGMTTVINDQGKLIGVFTDGDLRRTLDQSLDLRATPIEQVMTPIGTTVDADMLAAEALKVMQDLAINSLVVCDEENHPVGALNMHDMLKAGII